MTLIAIGTLKRFMKHRLYITTTRKELAGKVTLVYKKCIRPDNHMSTITTCRQLSKLLFSAPKMLDFLIINLGERLMRTKQLIDCSLSKKRMQNAEKLLIKPGKLLCYT